MLQCFDGTFYVGVTGNIERRLYQHHEGAFETCYTFMRRPLCLVYAGEFDRIAEAIDFEKKLKSWSHKKKRAFAQRDWPNLTRYSRGPDRTPVIPSVAPKARSRGTAICHPERSAEGAESRDSDSVRDRGCPSTTALARLRSG